MVYPVNNVAQQVFANPSQRTEAAQQQVEQRNQQDRSGVTSRTPQGTETQSFGTQAAQSQQSNARDSGGSNSRQTFSASSAQPSGDLPRGSLIDISA